MILVCCSGVNQRKYVLCVCYDDDMYNAYLNRATVIKRLAWGMHVCINMLNFLIRGMNKVFFYSVIPLLFLDSNTILSRKPKKLSELLNVVIH